MSTISPSLQIGGVNGWKSKEGAVLGWQQTSGNLFKPALFDFTRLSGSASYVDENGLIQIEHRSNYPRFTWQDGKQCLMNEEARTNDALWSQDFTKAQWATSDWGATTGVTDINGGSTAIRLTGDGVSANNAFFQAVTGTSGVAYTGSFYIRRVSGSGNITLRVGDVGGTSSPLALTSEWQRFEFTSTPTTTTVRVGVVGVAGATDVIEVCFGQLEQGSYASSYIPTSGSAVTRAAESIEGLNLGNFLGDSEGGLYVDALSFTADNQYFSICNEGAGLTQSILLGFNATSNTSRLRIQSGGSNLDIQGTAKSANTFYKMAGAFATNDLALVTDGTLENSSTSNSFFPSDLDRVAADNSSSSVPFRGLIAEIRAYNQRPTNVQMETETT